MDQLKGKKPGAGGKAPRAAEAATPAERAEAAAVFESIKGVGLGLGGATT